MKRFFALALTICLLALSLPAFAQPEFNFRGIPFQTTLKEVTKELECSAKPAEEWHGCSIEDLTTRGSYMAYPINESDPRAPYLYLVSETSGIEVAGHKSLCGTLFFVRPVDKGELSQKDEDAVFYAGSYDFFGDAEFAFNDLMAKLTALYGAPVAAKDEGNNNYYTWNGANDTAIVIHRIDNVIGYLRLSYIWLGAQELIAAANEAYIEPEPALPNGDYNGL